jgi:mercuric ion transport protein
MHPAPMTIKSGNQVERVRGLVAAGSLLGALAASSCCILPLVLFGLGVSGAWIGYFTRLAPYQPYVIAGTFTCLGAGYWLARQGATGSCSTEDACARPLPRRLIKVALLAATVLIIAALGFDWLAPLFLDS